MDKLVALYDQQMAAIKKAIEELLITDPILQTGIDRLCEIKGLGLLLVATLIAETKGFTGGSFAVWVRLVCLKSL